MAFMRLPLALVGSALAVLAYQWSGRPVGIAAGLGWSTLTLTLINLLCLGLLLWRSRVEPNIRPPPASQYVEPRTQPSGRFVPLATFLSFAT